MSIEFFRKRSPKLLKLIEQNFAPSLWGMYRKDAVENLHKAIMAKLNQSEKDGSGSSAPLQKFVNELVSEIKQRADLTSKGKSTKPKSKAQILRDALLNAEKYADVWQHLAERTLYDEGLTEAQRAELQDLFGEIPREPSGAIVRATYKSK